MDWAMARIRIRSDGTEVRSKMDEWDSDLKTDNGTVQAPKKKPLQSQPC